MALTCSVSRLVGAGLSDGARPDFFVSYARADESWATWIAVELEKTGWATVSQVLDFRPGHDFVHEMHRAAMSAERTIAVLSPAYLESEFGEAEWRAAFVDDPSGRLGKLVPVKVQRCRPRGILRTRVHIDLVDVDEKTARKRLLEGVGPAGPRPNSVPYPGSVPFPGAKPTPGQVRRPRRWRIVAGLAAVLMLLIAGTASAALTQLSAPDTLAAEEPTPPDDPTAEQATTAPTVEPSPPEGTSPSAQSGANAPAAAPPALLGQPTGANGPSLVPDPPIPSPKITTKSLPRIEVGKQLEAHFEATGGKPPYAWSIAKGSVPDGLELQPDGRFSGIASTPGKFTFTVSVTDSRRIAATKQFVLVVIAIVGDINEDGPVDCTDLNILKSQWNQTGEGLSGDLNDDHKVDLTDMSILLRNWTGQSSEC